MKAKTSNIISVILLAIAFILLIANGFVDDNKIAYDAAEVLYAELEKAIHESEDGYAMFKAAEGAYAAYHTIFYSSFKKLADKVPSSGMLFSPAMSEVR